MEPGEAQKEAYRYENHLSQFDGAKLRVLPGLTYLREYNPSRNSPYTMTQAMAEAFMQPSSTGPKTDQIGDFFGQKKELSQDKIGLILGEISARDRIRYDNLKSLYDDLLRIDCWRLKRPYPQNYSTDKTWTDLNKMELQLRDQIRRELKDAAKDTAFPAKDLREGLLEFKLQDKKSEMMNQFDGVNQNEMGGLEIELDSSQKEQKGDIHYQPNY